MAYADEKGNVEKVSSNKNKYGSILGSVQIGTKSNRAKDVTSKFGSIADAALILEQGGSLAREESVKKAGTVETKNGEADIASVTYEALQKNIDKSLSEYMNNGIRIIGAPHQFIKQTDPRYGSSELGRTFAKKIMFEAPLAYMKPGVPEFLPGTNSSFREAFKGAVTAIEDDSKKKALTKLLEDTGKDTIRYYGIKPAYSKFMSHVNALCRILAVLQGVDKVKVPWARGNATFGNYDWRLYKMESRYGNLTLKSSGNGFGDIFGKAKTSIINGITGNITLDDYEYIRYFAQPESSYSTSFSNSTTSSMLESITSQLEGMARELNTIGAITGISATKIGDAAATMTDNVLQAVGDYGGELLPGIERITSSIGNVLLGGHIVLPEQWGGSSWDNDFSFSVHLSCPYGNKLSKYIHIGVPMMFFLASVLPLHMSPNVISSPYLFQCFMPGFFDSDMCMVTSVSFDKSTDGISMGNTLPSEVKVNVGIKDLYSSLSMPNAHNIGDWMSNTGMMEFLATQAGVDISKQKLNTSFKLFTELLNNKITDSIQGTAYEIMMGFKHVALDWFNILN